VCEEALFLRRDSAVGVNDETGIQEQISNADGLVQQASGIETQVENEPVETAGAFAAQSVDRLFEFARRAFLELCEPNVSELVVD